MGRPVDTGWPVKPSGMWLEASLRRLAGRIMRVSILCLAGLAGLPVLAAGQEARPPEPVRIAYTEFPPFTYRNELGQPAGSLIELTRRVAVEAGYRPEFVSLPINRIYLYLRNGNIDLWLGLSGIPALKNDVLESQVTPSLVQLSAWYTEGTPPLTHFDDFRGKTVIVINGYSYGSLLEKMSRRLDVRITEAPHHRSAIAMLRRKRGDYLLDYRHPVQQILVDTDSSPVYESEVRTRYVAWLFSLARPDAVILRDAFDEAYMRLAARGEVEPVQQRGPAFLLPGISELDY